ncbi:HEAT repeat domain-containing protein [Sphaerospermopsis kisseleviana CS-549]|uniref:HEAT repeat domain-containing protein n=1 Tax=Sphaerospermopsis kisseleviana CS-549 TaxID=3021783 RepID=A0ABT4ZPZ4_9CYAN|nr:HEAT repeat domain-containing protein [Sphaerospermopsis kisseleviana]MDB9441475.1 HEAT repeat domain-containing protein [Sphaerospermopsis kisseleviana CS-549]BAZ83754.1 putative signal transduction protein containing Nacht domain [Sphaerospermopsis kisseleviana NIES-73]
MTREAWLKSDEKGLARYVHKEAGQFLPFSQNQLDLLKQPNGRHLLIEVIYNTLCNLSIQYALEKYDQSNDTQQIIREPSEIIGNIRQGTCLDLAAFFCGVCLTYELLPLLIIIKGHALVAVSLNHGFGDYKARQRKEYDKLFKRGSGLLSLTDSNNLTNFINLVDSGQYLFIECTGFAQSDSLNSATPEGSDRINGFLTFEQAIIAGRKQFEPETNRPPQFALDIAVIYHEESWQPLPISLPDMDSEIGKAVLLEKDVKNFFSIILNNIETDLNRLKNNSDIESQEKFRYIPIQVTSERISQPLVETPLIYGEHATELKRIYAYKGFDNELAQRYKVNWEEAKAKEDYKVIMVLADPGMGKSTLLRMDAWNTAQQQKDNLGIITIINDEDLNFPILLRLSQIAKKLNEDSQIINLIPTLIEKISNLPKEVFPILNKNLKDGKCLVFLDALDEVPPIYRDRLKRKLNDFASIYSGKIICTSRIVGYDKIFFNSNSNKVVEVEIVPFGQNQIEQYISWFINDNLLVERLISELRNKPQIMGLAQNPLLLSLICNMYNKPKPPSLPAKRTEIYRQTINNFMSTEWDEERKKEVDIVDSDTRKEAKVKLLSEIAYNLSSNSNDNIHFDELNGVIEQVLNNEDNEIKSDLNDSKPIDLIRELSEKDGILQKMESEENDEESHYLFLHRTFQEYFTALYLANDENLIEEAIKHIWQYEWHETLTLLTGLIEKKLKAVAFIKSIKEQRDDIFYTLKLLAGRCLAERKLDDSDLVEDIYHFWHKFPSANFIRSTVVTIGQVNSQMFRMLKETLENTNESEQVRSEAALALGEIRNSEAIPALNATLKSSNPRLKRQSALALGDIGTSDAIKLLIECFKDPSYVSSFQSLYGNNKEYEICSALAIIGNREVIEELIKFLNNKEEDINYRISAAKTLAKIGNETRQENDKIQIIEAIVNAINEISGYILNKDVQGFQEKLIWALSEISNEKVMKYLIKVLNDKQKNIQTRTTTARALGKIGSSEAVQALITTFNEENDSDTDINDIRTTTARALGKISSPEAVQALIKACEHTNKFVKSSALKALGEIDNLKVEEILVDTKNNHQNEKVRNKAELAWKNIQSKKNSNSNEPAPTNSATGIDINMLPKIIADIDTSNTVYIDKIRNQAKEDLRRFNNPEGASYLTEVLKKTKCSELKIEVSFALGRIGKGNEQAMEALILTLKDNNRNVIRAVVSALEECSTEKTLRRLIELSHTEVNIYDPDVFYLARKLAIKFNQSKVDFIPVYPELVSTQQ